MQKFPTHPDELTTDWLTSVFQAGGHLGENRQITEFESHTIGEGLSLLGLVQRVTLTSSPGDGPPAPGSVVIKFAHPLEENRAIAMNTRMYEREIDFFEHLAPDVDERGLALAQTVLQRSTQTVTDRNLLSILEGAS